MKQIKTDNAAALPNAAHVQKNLQVLSIIPLIIATQLKLEALWNDYNSLFLKEDEAFKLEKSYELTPEIVALDKMRDEIFMFIINTIRTNTANIDRAKKLIAEQLLFAAKPYIGTQNKSYFEQSGLIANMVQDFQSAINAPKVAALGLTDAVVALNEKSEEFNGIYSTRFNETEYRKAIENMKTIRPKVDAAYHVLRDAINAAYMYNEQVLKDPAKKTLLESIIDNINAVLDMAKQMMAHRGKKKGEGTTDVEADEI